MTARHPTIGGAGRRAHDLQTRIDRLVRAAQMPGYNEHRPERMIEMMEERI